MKTRNYDFVRTHLLNKAEIAFLDVREEDPHAKGHPLFAANMPVSQIELNAYRCLPRRSVPLVLIDNGEGHAESAAEKLTAMGYVDVSVFEGGLDAWLAAGGEIFIDVNVPSKAFGEMVEAACHTPSLPAEQVKKLIDSKSDYVIVDVRRFDEYHTMCIPTATSVPGAELVLRVPDLAPNPETQVIVNCAGRTRSLIGTQSLINAGLPNPVAALRNGTIGWTLANQKLDYDQSQRYQETSASSTVIAAKRARKVAEKAGVKWIKKGQLDEWRSDNNRTSYFFDVRSPAEYEAGHLPGFYPIAGGQLVQETEMYAPVRGARIVLADDDGARANMTASWLVQMAWEVYVLEGLEKSDFAERGPWRACFPELPVVKEISAEALKACIDDSHQSCLVIDLSRHAVFIKQHIPGAWYLLRSELGESVRHLPAADKFVITSDDGVLAQFAIEEFLAALSTSEVYLLTGGNQAWFDAGFPMTNGVENLASDPIDRYRRPYEGTNVSPETMQAYLDWEFGLVEQMRKDGTHHFKPLVI